MANGPRRRDPVVSVPSKPRDPVEQPMILSCSTNRWGWVKNTCMDGSELRGIHILADLTNEQLGELINYGEFLPYAVGHMIINQGERADAMFLLVNGTVAAYVKGKDGNESHLRTMEAGAHFGEIGLLEDGIRTASVRAGTNCRVFRLRKDSFREILQKPELATPFLHSLSRSLAIRLADVTSRLSDARSLKDAWTV
jgi:CRP-like cAMP-binding protein